MVLSVSANSSGWVSSHVASICRVSVRPGMGGIPSLLPLANTTASYFPAFKSALVTVVFSFTVTPLVFFTCAMSQSM